MSISSEKKAASHSRWPFSAEENQRPRVSGMGSGVLIDGRGYILTNHHVVDKVQGIEVQLFDGTTLPGPGAPVRPGDGPGGAQGRRRPRRCRRSRSARRRDLMVGETVITIGNAFGYENTVSVGIVSALHRDVTLSDEQVYRNLIQTDACINPGNSGGPLINIDGELIGINVAVRAGAQGIGFALPIDEVKRVAAEMMSTRRLAVDLARPGRRRAARGAKRRASWSPRSSRAARRKPPGFKPGDELVRVGDLAIASPLDIERGLLDVRPGHPATVTIRRGEHRDRHAPRRQAAAAHDGRRHDPTTWSGGCWA